VFSLTIKDTSSSNIRHQLSNIDTLPLGTAEMIINDGITFNNTMSVNTQEIIGVEVFDLVAEDNADITFKQSEQAGLNNIKLSGGGDITIVTGDLTTNTTSFTGTTRIITTDDKNVTTINIDQLTDTYFLSGNYDSATGLFTTTVEGIGTDTLIYEGADADALTDSATNAVILVGVDLKTLWRVTLDKQYPNSLNSL
jgi:hypothetical protein